MTQTAATARPTDNQLRRITAHLRDRRGGAGEITTWALTTPTGGQITVRATAEAVDDVRAWTRWTVSPAD